MHKTSGILPVLFDNDGTPYYLLGQERQQYGYQQQLKWSAFQGCSKEEDRDHYETASREFYEENMGVIGGCVSDLAKELKCGDFKHLVIANISQGMQNHMTHSIFVKEFKGVNVNYILHKYELRRRFCEIISLLYHRMNLYIRHPYNLIVRLGAPCSIRIWKGQTVIIFAKNDNASFHYSICFVNGVSSGHLDMIQSFIENIKFKCKLDCIFTCPHTGIVCNNVDYMEKCQLMAIRCDLLRHYISKFPTNFRPIFRESFMSTIANDAPTRDHADNTCQPCLSG